MAARARIRQARLAAMAMLLATGFAAQAQERTGASPADAKASVPPVFHASPFAGYRPHGEPKVAPWREANDEVGRIGGWKAYSREAYEAAQAKEAAGKAAKPAMHHHGAKPPQ